MSVRIRPSSSRKRLLPLLIAGCLVAVGLGEPAAVAAANSKPYALDVSPHPVSAGSTTTYTATYTNETGTQQLGSSNLTAPAGFTLVSASSPSPTGTATVVGNSVQLRDLSLPPGGIMTVSLVAQAPCPPGVYGWSAVTKQANNFSGTPGNNLSLDAANSNLGTTLTGPCSLGFGFSAQPSDAQVNTNITSQPFLPSGGAVQVQVLDAAGNLIGNSTVPVTLSILSNPVGGHLLGVKTVNAVAGVASFGAISIDLGGLGYSLQASTTAEAIDPGASASFDIYDIGKRCTSGPCSSPKVTKGNTTAEMTTSPGTDGDLFALGVAIEGGLNCPGYDAVSAIVTFFVSGSRTKVVTILVPKTAVSGGPSSRQICYSSPVPFVDRTGASVTTGLLPDCGSVAPCVISRSPSGKFIAVTFSAPAGDPHGRT